jgi:hypothetical protein
VARPEISAPHPLDLTTDLWVGTRRSWTRSAAGGTQICGSGGADLGPGAPRSRADVPEIFAFLPQISGRAPEDLWLFCPRSRARGQRSRGRWRQICGRQPEICVRPAQICAMRRKILPLSGDRSTLFSSISGGRLAEPFGLSTMHHVPFEHRAELIVPVCSGLNGAGTHSSAELEK